MSSKNLPAGYFWEQEARRYRRLVREWEKQAGVGPPW